MAYIKQNFSSGQTLTAVQLNNIEAGLIALEDEKLDAASLPDAIDNALAQAKESGEFKGDSPVRGTDYWTEEDIATIKAYVDDAILNGSW